MNSRATPRPASVSPTRSASRDAPDLAEDDVALLRDVADRIVGAGMAVPAMLLLESVAPMNFVSATMLRLISPAWQALMPRSRIEQVAAILERRSAIPAFLRMIDEAEDERRRYRAAERGRKASGSGS